MARSSSDQLMAHNERFLIARERYLRKLWGHVIIIERVVVLVAVVAEKVKTRTMYQFYYYYSYRGGGTEWTWGLRGDGGRRSKGGHFLPARSPPIFKCSVFTRTQEFFSISFNQINSGEELLHYCWGNYTPRHATLARLKETRACQAEMRYQPAPAAIFLLNFLKFVQVRPFCFSSEWGNYFIHWRCTTPTQKVDMDRVEKLERNLQKEMSPIIIRQLFWPLFG